MFPSIIPKELVQLIETTPDEIEIIDVRSLSEFDACHVV
jgi:rhodanese-related sulfurtransferase